MRREKAGSIRSASLLVTTRMPSKDLDPLEQEVGLEIGVAVVRRRDVGAARHQGVAFVEQQHDVQRFGRRERALEALFGLADIFADRGGEIDAVKILAERGGDMARGERLAGTAGTGEQRTHAAAAAGLAQRLAVAAAQDQRVELGGVLSLELERLGCTVLDRRGQRVEAGIAQVAQRGDDVLARDLGMAGKRGAAGGAFGRAADIARGEREIGECGGERREADGAPLLLGARRRRASGAGS